MMDIKNTNKNIFWIPLPKSYLPNVPTTIKKIIQSKLIHKNP